MGGKNQTVTQRSQPWSAAQPALIGAIGEAQRIYGNGGFSNDPYQGNRVAGFGPATQAAQAGIMSRAAGGAPGIDASRSALMDMMSGDAQYRGMDGVRQNILGSAIPAAAATFSGSGMLNSSTAQDGVGRAASEALAPFEYGAYENAQNRSLQAAGMMPGIEAAAYLPQQMQAQVGAQQDAMSQARINADMQRWNETQGQEAANFQPFLNAIMGLGGMGSSNSSTQPTPGTGLGAGITGGLGMYGALSGIPALAGTQAPVWGAILSGLAGICDRRTKTDATRIGRLDSGVPVYRFRYVGSPKWHIGVMADEVPHAIVGQVAGFDVIDYGRVA